MSKIVDLSSGLSVDYEKLYESSKYTDISIHVGREPKSKIFLAHTLVLCTRSKFFENSLTGSTDASDGVQKAAIMFEDVTPDVFEVLLRYIYTGQTFYDSCKSISWISLLDGASKFELFDLLTALETYLIDKQQEWIQQNIVTVHKFALSTASLNKLQDHCKQIMISHPDVIFKSNDIATLPKETLVTLIKSDELNMNEDEVWMSIVQWATKQVPELQLGDDLNDWSSNDINTVKDIMTDFLPHIRFFSISHKTIVLYNDLLPRNLRRDILNFHADNEYKPSTRMLPPRTPLGYEVDSLIINRQQAKWISSKIVESAMRCQKNQKTSVKQNVVYKLTLLYRQSRDGNTIAKFREFCNNKGPTIVVGRVLGTEEILGGYNPNAWGSNKGYVNTKESFIFALDRNLDKCIVSFVHDSKSANAIYDYNSWSPVFGDGRDLSFGDCGAPKAFAKKTTYEVPIRNSSDGFEWADWEAFLISKL